MSITETEDDTERKEAAPRPNTLWIKDAELIRRLGIPEKIARDALRMLDADHRHNGFPQKRKLYGDRRYWPAVKAWFDRTEGLKTDAPVQLKRVS